MAGLSYRDITYVLRVVPCSHEAVRLLVKKLEQLTVNVEAKPRRMVAVDETKVKADGEWCYVWAAMDVDTRELLAVWVSWQRSILNAEAFLRKVLEACINKPFILIDKGPLIKLSNPFGLNGFTKHSVRETALNTGSEQ